MSEDFNHIDQIIRQKFENFESEPPVQVWDKIRSGIDKNPDPPSSPGIILPIVVAISLLIFVGGLVHHFYAENNNPGTKAGGLSVQAAGVVSTGSTTVSDLSLEQAIYKTTAEVPVAQDKTITAASNRNEVGIPVRIPFEETHKVDRKKKSSAKAKQTVENKTEPAGHWKPGLVQAIKSGELSYADAVKYDLNMRDIRKLSGYTDYAKKKRADWSIGAYFNPEASSCNDKGIENTMSYNIGVMPAVTFNHFFVQSGINVRFTHDKGNYSVDYNRFLGTYEDVYLVTFDTTDQGIIPTYYTNTVEVYDTVNHYSISETKANYTYLEVPVMFGYRHTFGKFSLFAKAGPAASFLAVKNLPDAGSPEEKARIVNVDYQVPVRSVINWQLMMGAGFDYQIADKISFSLEPTFRYALKPEYDLPGSRGNTRSFGVRAGLNYKF